MDPAKPRPGRDLLDEALDLMRRCGFTEPARWLLVDALAQTLYLMAGRDAAAAWPVSTAAAGLDNREDSGGTPPGLHRIAGRIGDGAPAGTVFVSRERTGTVWRPGDRTTDDLVLTRILALDGCEDGVNRGPGVDSLERYIYIHGTNHEDAIGRPASHGCVRMTNRDVVDLFDRVAEGDPVVIL